VSGGEASVDEVGDRVQRTNVVDGYQFVARGDSRSSEPFRSADDSTPILPSTAVTRFGRPTILPGHCGAIR
jgi:hypothetical protein